MVVIIATAKSPRWHHCQHDPTPTLCCGQVVSTAPSPAWLSTDIASRSSHLSSTITSVARWPHHTMTNVASAVASPAWLGGLAFAYPTSSPTRRITTNQARGAWRVPLQPTARLRYIFNYIIDHDSRRVRCDHHVMGHFAKAAKSFS
jgi:hypothetical protein